MNEANTIIIVDGNEVEIDPHIELMIEEIAYMSGRDLDTVHKSCLYLGYIIFGIPLPEHIEIRHIKH